MNEEIIKTIADVIEISPDKISLDMTLQGDLGLESLDLVALVTTFEKKYDVVVEDKEIKNLQTVKDVVDYIKAHV